MVSETYRELLIGCGNRRGKDIRRANRPVEWLNLTTLDIDPNCGADVEHDLERFPYPFPDNRFDEIHAYEVLEHCGWQGDYRFFFRQWEEFWRIMKPGAEFMGSVPLNDATRYGDPGHRRVILFDTLTRLNQDFYKYVGQDMPIGDYRFCYRADFYMERYIPPDDPGDRMFFSLRAIKPSRISL